MDFVFYNLSDAMQPTRDVHTVMPAIVFSKDAAHHASEAATVGNFFEHEFFTTNPKRIANMYANLSVAEMGEKYVNDVVTLIEMVEKLQKRKFKSKAELVAIARGKKVRKEACEYVQRTGHNMSIVYEMHRANPFIKSNLLKNRYMGVDRDNPDAKDETMLKYFMDVVSENDFGAMMICSERMTEGQNIESLSSENVWAGFFNTGILKLKLFDLPGFLSLKKSKYQLIRDDFQPELETWWKTLYDVATLLSKIKFNSENFQEIKRIVEEKIAVASEALNKKIKNSIYMQQLANDEYGEYTSTLSFAVSSRMQLLELYRSTKQMTDQIFTTLREHYSAKNIHDNICCFMIHEVPALPPKREYTRDMQDEWDKIWQDSLQE
jgi:hypothetical protein